MGEAGDFGYARVSSDEQAKGHSIENQVARLEAAGCCQVFRDIESAYRTVIRPEFQQMLEYIQSGAARGKYLKVTNLDRLSRHELTAFLLFEMLDEYGVRLLSLDQPYIDLNHPDGRAMAGYSVIDARAYSARLSMRVKQGHQRHRDRNAGYFSPFGYIKINEQFQLDHKPFLCLLETQEEMSRAAIGRDVVETFLSCRSLRRTLRSFNQKYGIASYAGRGRGNKQARGKLHFHPSSLAAWLNNPILRGHLAYGRSYKQRQSHKHLWDIRYGTHPEQRLLTDEEYHQVEEILDWNAEHGGSWLKEGQVIHPLSGLIYCGECRGSCRLTHYRLRTDHSVKVYSYQCSNYHLKACSQKRSIREAVLEQAIIDALTNRAEAITHIAELPPECIDPPELQALRAELAYYQQAPGNRAAGIVADLQRQIEQFRYQQTTLSATHSANRELLLRCFGDQLFWKTLLDEEKREIYRQLVERVTVKDGQVVRVSLKV